MVAPQVSILVVEDEFLILLSTSDQLREAGFLVYEAPNAEAAFQLLRAHPEIDVMFTDVNMPGSLNGLELSTAVHEMRPRLKIIITSGLVVPPVGLLSEEIKFIPKPYHPNQVVRAVHQLVR